MLKRTLWIAIPLIGLVTTVMVARGGGMRDKNMVYRGHLETGGTAVATPVALKFRFFNAATGGTWLPSGAPQEFTFPSVALYQGDFSVEIGPVPDAILASDPVFIEVEVNGGTLAQRQRIFPAPFAMRGRTEGSFFIDSTAEVAGNLVVNGSDLVLGRAD